MTARTCHLCQQVKPSVDFIGRSRACSDCHTKRFEQRASASSFSRTAGLPVRNSTSTDLYSGAELRDFTGRPGAMDAYRLPSLIGPKRVYR